MPSLSTYKKILSTYGSTNGQARKIQSDMIMEQTWDEDIQGVIGYLYDYYHDDEPELNYGLNSMNSNTKTSIDVKYIVHAYNSDDKDQVSYYIQFKPSQKCNVEYYEDTFKRKCGAEFPVGLYIDIPDNKGIYRRWLVCDKADFYAPQFPTWSILPCDYRFCWIYKNSKYKLWGCSRGQSSYSSGIETGTSINSIDNAKKCKLPFNDVSATLYYDQRMVISAPIDTPLTWKISKIENTVPFGVNIITFDQDKFDQHKDYIEKDKNGNVIAMWADYFESSITPEDRVVTPEEDVTSNIYSKIAYSGTKPQLKVGGSYKTFTANYYDANNILIETPDGKWQFRIGDVDILTLDEELLEIISSDFSLSSNQIKLKFIGSEDYLGEILTISYQSGDVISSVDMEIVGI